MNRPAVSVVILTRDRPREFRALLEALALQRARDFEVICVGRLPRAEDHGAPPALAARLTWLTCAAENISRARNIGAAAAQGAILAFIDDDAAPEPDWLTELAAPFAAPDTGCVGGHVRGRNGVDFQWRGGAVNRSGDSAPVAAQDLLTRDYGDPRGPVLAPLGCNMAVRRVALAEIGGFDERYRYYLDESDLARRLAGAGWRTRFAPAAEAHHAFARSLTRAANRAPLDLFEVGASRAVFARVHGGGGAEDFVAAQEARLRRYVQAGRMSRRQAAASRRRLIDGLAAGAVRPGGAPGLPPPRAGAWTPYSAHPDRPRVAIAAHPLRRAAARRMAEALAGDCEVSLIDFTLGARPLKVSFAGGLWRHSGGLLGRESFDADYPAPGLAGRIRRELARIAPRRAPEALILPVGVGRGEAFGAPGYVVEAPAGAPPALRRALAAGAAPANRVSTA